MKINIYTDGACDGTPGNGGWAAILKVPGYTKEISGGLAYTTNNRMEIMAVLEGLKAIKDPGAEVTIYSDSRYVINSIEKKWLNKWVSTGFDKGKKNKDLWMEIWNLLKLHKVRLVWVRGHNGHPENERCDELAVLERKKPDLAIDHFCKQDYESRMELEFN